MRLTGFALISLLLAVGCDDKPSGDDSGDILSDDTASAPDDTGAAEDKDGDGYTTDTDCDDNDPNVNPGAEEIPYNGVSDDCNPSTPDDDLDADGYDHEDDCDDTDDTVYPGATEVCDGLDNDCDGTVDDSTGDLWYQDEDGDSYGDADVSTLSCDGASGWVADATDCDDSDATVYPGADELCDGQDNDCDGDVDEDVLTTWYADTDGDGYGTADRSVDECEAPSGWVSDATDCDDSNADVHPGVDELCDGVDNDCDGDVDDDDSGVTGQSTWYRDADADGYGDASASTLACDQPLGQVADATDCDDTDDSIHPGAAEVCDDADVDEDCDGLADDDDSDVTGQTDFFVDADGDGYGDESSVVSACDQPSDTLTDGGDCDDGDPQVNPDATEVCGDGVDNDCDGSRGQCGLDGDIDLWSADAQIIGETSYDYAGASLSAGGDINGDGQADLVIGASYESSAGSAAGSVYVLNGPTGSVEYLSSAAAQIIGEHTGDYAGTSVAAGLDVNDDGYDDVFIGAYGDDDGDTNAGAAFLQYGPISGNTYLGYADAKLIGERSSDYAGYDVALLDDVNSDGFADMLISAHGSDTGGSSTGTTYLVLGPVSGDLDLIRADAEIVGEDANDYAGRALSSAGDLDGDGFSDAVIGAYGSDAGGSSSGAAYVLMGPFSGGLSLASADARLIGDSTDYAGWDVAAAGDTDGDGYGDLLIGAPYNSSVHRYGGVGYLVSGVPSGDLDLSADSAARYFGESSQDFAGYSVAGAGDVDGDGKADVLIGAYGNDENGSNAGAAYLVYGPMSGSKLLSDADARMYGERSGDYAGQHVAAAGDMDDDGYDDVLVAAPYEDTAATQAGSVYLLLGGGY